MRTFLRLLVAAVVLAGVIACIELAVPGGVRGLAASIAGERRDTVPATETVGGVERVATSRAPVVPGTELERAERAYDQGDFSYAVTMFTLARATASSAADRERASSGLERALLAEALVDATPGGVAPAADAGAAYARAVAAAESSGDERVWLDALRVAVAAGSRDKLPYVAGQSIAAARTGGPVELLLASRLARTTGPRAAALRQAIVAKRLDPAATAAARGTDVASGRGARDDEESGIGGTVDRGVPYGAFSPAMRRRVAEAAALERRGEEEYEKAQPGATDRREHRLAALAHLRAARDIYQAAQEEDPNSQDLEKRLSAVMRLIAELNKDASIGDR